MYFFRLNTKLIHILREKAQSDDYMYVNSLDIKIIILVKISEDVYDSVVLWIDKLIAKYIQL